MSDTFQFIKKNKTINYTVSKPGFMPVSGSFVTDSDKTINITLTPATPITLHLTYNYANSTCLPETIYVYGTCQESSVNSDTVPRQQYFSNLLYTFETTNGTSQNITIPNTYENVYLFVMNGGDGTTSNPRLSEIGSYSNCQAAMMGYSWHGVGSYDAFKVVLNYNYTDAYVTVYEFTQ